MKTIVSTFALIVLLLTISSCAVKKAPTVVSEDDINSAIIVTAPPEVNTFKSNDFVDVEVQNNSDHEVLLSLESAIDIKARQGDEWASVPMAQKMFRKILLSPCCNVENSLTLFSIIPQVKSGNATDIRITITGIDQSTGQEVSGYVDITLHP